MKFAIIAAVFAVSVMAQTKDQIPKCAIPCMEVAVQANTGCSLEDFKCICEKRSQAFDHSAIVCVTDACGRAEAMSKVLPAAQAICDSVKA
ncbi:hypothetical protein K4F52_000768 [Lecanicillium sp. MT-2017a]|nr:hypothetical protein K4F52_000768 [Lecanicillium sp. MT-2017a]